MLCYKYMSWEYWFDTMLLGRIKTGRPSEFNDPFDCVGAINGRVSEDVAREFSNKVCEKYINPSVDFAKKELAKRLLSYRCCELTGKVLADKEYLNEIFRVACFSVADRISKNSELLMWSHYADNAKGVRFAIDIPNASDIYALERIRYSEEMPVYDVQKEESFLCGPQWNRAFKQFICTKSLAWEYEQEVRMIFDITDTRSPISTVKGIDFFYFPREWIKSVTFGSEIDWPTAVHHAHMVRLTGCSGIKILKAVRISGAYALDYKEIE